MLVYDSISQNRLGFYPRKIRQNINFDDEEQNQVDFAANYSNSPMNLEEIMNKYHLNLMDYHQFRRQSIDINCVKITINKAFCLKLLQVLNVSMNQVF